MEDFSATKIKIEEDDLHCIETIFIQVKEEALDYEDEGDQNQSAVILDDHSTKCVKEIRETIRLNEANGFSKQDIDYSLTTVRMMRFYIDLYKNGAPDKTRFTCHICYISFKTKDNLCQHLVTHSTQKPFTCDICKNSFIKLTEFNNHIWLKKHYNCNMYFAPECKYHCYVCNIDFDRQHPFLIHTRTHNDYNKPFRCDICNKSYKLSSVLKKHVLTHL